MFEIYIQVLDKDDTHSRWIDYATVHHPVDVKPEHFTSGRRIAVKRPVAEVLFDNYKAYCMYMFGTGAPGLYGLGKAGEASIFWTSRVEDVLPKHARHPYVVLYVNKHGTTQAITNPEDLEGFFLGQAMANQWKPNMCDAQETMKTANAVPTPDAINPSHYQGFLEIKDHNQDITLQWLETMQYHVRYRNKPEVFCGAIELQVRKYLDRNGQKDEELQEVEKSLWYLKFLTAFMKNGYKPIRVAEIDTILAKK